MSRNPASGVPQYGANGFLKLPSVAKVQDGTLRCYWFPSQTRSNAEAEAFIAFSEVLDPAYVAPSAWPTVGMPLKLPKVVLWSIPSTRTKAGGGSDEKWLYADDGPTTQTGVPDQGLRTSIEVQAELTADGGIITSTYAELEPQGATLELVQVDSATGPPGTFDTFFVAYMLNPLGGTLTERGNFWLNLGHEVKAELESAYGDVGVIVVADDAIDGDQIAQFTTVGRRFVRWFTPVSDDVTTGDFLGADVLCIQVEQDFGFSDYHANDQDFEPGELALRAGQYADDYDQFAAAWPLFRRHVTWLVQDVGEIDPAHENGYHSPDAGGPGPFTDDAAFQDYCAWWRTEFKDNIMSGSGTWAGRALEDVGWSYEGTVDYTTATAGDFVNLIVAHFELE